MRRVSLLQGVCSPREMTVVGLTGEQSSLRDDTRQH